MRKVLTLRPLLTPFITGWKQRPLMKTCVSCGWHWWVESISEETQWEQTEAEKASCQNTMSSHKTIFLHLLITTGDSQRLCINGSCNRICRHFVKSESEKESIQPLSFVLDVPGLFVFLPLCVYLLDIELKGLLFISRYVQLSSTIFGVWLVGKCLAKWLDRLGSLQTATKFSHSKKVLPTKAKGNRLQGICGLRVLLISGLSDSDIWGNAISKTDVWVLLHCRKPRPC